MSLIIKDLTIGHTNNQLYDSVSFEANPGMLYGLLGRNGAGKSTLLNTLSGLLPLLNGEVLINGKSIRQMSAQERAKSIAIVTTDKVAIPYMSVRNLVALGRFPYSGALGKLTSADHDIIEKSLAMAGASNIAEKPTQSLSDGERQKVMLARALAQSTPILLLDEPTAHLDVPQRIKVFQQLKKLAKEDGKIVIIATHEVELTLKLCDQVLLLAGHGTWLNKNPMELIVSDKINEVFCDAQLRFNASSGRFEY